ncbi:MAG: type I-C CRISPR-associated protein Cas7/Csd2 [Rikenellaceae bacterium]
MSKIVNKRYEFIILFDVKDGNPNGDPDNDNAPRVDPQTGEGIITDVCLKRKVRNYVEMVKGEEAGNRIYIKQRAVLNKLIDEAYEQSQVEEVEGYDKVHQAREWMCAQYWDIRTFGALMTSGKNAGQVRGPIQMTFARSVEPIIMMDNCVVRIAVTTEKESEKQKGENRTMGRKYTIPYALYQGYGYISANLAAQSGFTEDDLELFWQGLINMFEEDRSSLRGQMSVRKLIIFEHSSKFGNAPSSQLFDRVSVEKINPMDVSRNFKDYNIKIDRESLPKGVKIIEKL